MILHIFRTKVMNRGLNSKRLVKKIKKNGERPPSVPPRREEGLSKLRDCFAFACMEKSTIRHLRRHFRFGFGGLRRRERGDGGVGLFFTVLGGGEVVHLFEKA